MADTAFALVHPLTSSSFPDSGFATPIRLPSGLPRVPSQQRRRPRMCNLGGAANSGGATADDNEPPRLSTDWRSFRARLVDGEATTATGSVGGRAPSRMEDAKEEGFWAHRVSAPEPGCVLVARPDVIQGGYFEKTVVLVLSHSNSGTFGLCLNKIMSKSLASVPVDASSPVGEAFHMAKVECFLRNPLMSGGPLGLDSLMILHDKELAEAAHVIGDVHCGDLMGAMVAVRTGELDSRRCHFFSGYSAWSGGQLDGEISEGAWDIVATSTKYILDFAHSAVEDDRGPCLWSTLREKVGL